MFPTFLNLYASILTQNRYIMVKQAVIIALLIVTAFSVVSCDSDDNTTVNPYAQFQGNWNGTFSGDDEGTWKIGRAHV